MGAPLFPEFYGKTQVSETQEETSLFFSTWNFAYNNGGLYLPMALENGRKW
jgi:hypothetical protein